jgi:hypothetical protein
MSDEEMKKEFTRLTESLRPTLDKMVELCRKQTGAPGIRIELAHTDIDGQGSLEVNVKTSMNPEQARMAHMMEILKKLAEGAQLGTNIVGDQGKDKKAKEESKQEAPPADPILPEAMQKFLDGLGGGGANA